MLIIFDLDHTLLDTARFKIDLAGVFSGQDFGSDYKKYFKDRGINFDFEEYLDILEGEGKIGPKERRELRTKLDELMDRLNEYLKPDAENVLRHYKESGAKLVLMTFGDKKWQAEKVSHLSISRYFDEIIFEDKSKQQSEFLRSLSGGEEEILVINDNFRESEAMLEVLKKGWLCLVEGGYNRDRRPDIKELKELMPAEGEEKGRERKELKLK